MPLTAPLLSILAVASGHAALNSPGEPGLPEPTIRGAGWLSGPANDYNLSITADGRRLVFGRSPTGDFEGAQILMATRGDADWSAPEPVFAPRPGGRDSDPWLTPDGAWLYFVSDRPAVGRAQDRRDMDLWRAPIAHGRIGTPEHLAAASSPGEELGPELHGGALVFNSTRTGGPAPLALYRAPVTDSGIGPAEALPAPFNAGQVQGDLTFSPDGRTALFWSVRGESREPDLFAVLRQGDGWSEAIRLPAPFNAPGMDFTPAFSADGGTLYWASQRNGTDGHADVVAIAAAQLSRALEAADTTTHRPGNPPGAQGLQPAL
jgi:dipeptidyl aminopeptidase/acylaminoacyl peptidase